MFTLAIPDSFYACSATKIIQDGASVHTQERLWRRNREEKPLRHVAMVAKFLDDNKPIKSLKSLFALCRTSPILFNFILFGKSWRNFLWDRIYRYLSLEKESDNFCVVFTYSIKRACEARKFHVIVVQRWQRNVRVIDVQSCCLLI